MSTFAAKEATPENTERLTKNSNTTYAEHNSSHSKKKHRRDALCNHASVEMGYAYHRRNVCVPHTVRNSASNML